MLDYVRASINEFFGQTYFDVDFDPDIVIGPSVLEFLQDFFTRYHSSIDIIFTVLQVSLLPYPQILLFSKASIFLFHRAAGAP